jgi:NodT family efflux transporter outer membrane factor (OMF) lipoprotein
MKLPPATRSVLLLLVPALLLAGCANLAPKYEVPSVETPQAFKEGKGVWVPAAPADTLARGEWWKLFDDPALNQLAADVEASNQTVAAAVAAYDQARALTREQRAAMFPQVNLDASANRTGGPDKKSASTYNVNIGASWEPDVFGRLRLTVDSARYGEQVQEADLAAARLAAQGELASNYFTIRQADLFYALQQQVVEGYGRALQITRNRYDAGVVARTDVLQAETQLANAQADLLALERTRQTSEHAVAVLVGRAASDFSIPVDLKWSVRVPQLPAEMPSTLLQRRPDIAAAERQVAQANAQIGIARAGYFPSFGLTGSLSSSAATIGDLFKASSLAWAVGLTATQMIFDGGATSARVDEARASWRQAAANYRQTTLAAFQNVEDQLVALRVLQQQETLYAEASRAADLVEQQILNRYQAGQVQFTDVITAQQNAATARRNLVQTQVNRQVTIVALIQSLGGGWSGLAVAEAAQ